MRAGSLRHRVTITSPTVGHDTTGHPHTTGTTSVGTVWAAVESLDSPETATSDGKRGKAQIKVTMRYLSTVTAKCSLSWGGRTWHVSTCTHSADKRHTVLTCAEA